MAWQSLPNDPKSFDYEVDPNQMDSARCSYAFSALNLVDEGLGVRYREWATTQRDQMIRLPRILVVLQDNLIYV